MGKKTCYFNAQFDSIEKNPDDATGDELIADGPAEHGTA